MTAIETETLFEYILIEYRWVLVVFFLLPISVVWKVWSIARNYVVFKLSSAPKMHDQKVKNVQRQVKAWLAGDRSTKLCTARPTWQTMSIRQATYKPSCTQISVKLVDILEVDTEKMTVRCEPLVTMGQLSRTLEPLGLALPMVPEMDELTVGGLVMGTGVESSSHIHGLFQHQCLGFELVLADGSVVTCSKEENPDLFYAVPWSVGTLGFLTSATLKLIPAKKYIRLEYHSYTSLAEFSARFQEETVRKDPNQFLEGLLFTKDRGVVMVGNMVDTVAKDGKYNPIGKWNAEWFFTQVERHLVKYEQGGDRAVVEYIPLRDYYHRHTKSLFWELQDIVSFGNNPVFRFLFGWLMPPEVSLLKLTQTETMGKLYDRAHVIQDVFVPIDCLTPATELINDKFGVYPLWLCPLKVLNNPGLLRTQGQERFLVDIGVYGVPKAPGYETIPAHRSIENFVIKNNGFQMLCNDTHTSEEEFRTVFDHTLYDKVKKSLPYCKEAFPDIYHKVKRSVRK